MGAGSGMWSSPKLVWNGPINGTLLAVLDFHSGFRLENFLLDGNKRAAHLVHVRVRINPSGSTHNSQLSNLQFTGYRSYALILGTNDEQHLGAGGESLYSAAPWLTCPRWLRSRRHTLV